MIYSVQGQNVYIVGIKGQGTAALALVLQAHGAHVEGSDITEHFSTDPVLQSHAIPVHTFADAIPENVTSVIYSTAYSPDSQPQLIAARQRRLPIRSYPEALGTLFDGTESISVCGSHGKTTSTAMVGSILIAAQKDPTVIVGSPVKEFGGNARIGHSALVVIETDEYQNKFKYYHPRHVLLTNVDYDHPDFFTDAAMYTKTFADFLITLPKEGTLVVRSDDVNIQSICATLDHPVVTFGKSDDAEYRLIESVASGDGQTFRFVADGEERAWSLPLPGEHNALNALGAVAMCHALGVDWDVMEKALATFQGVARRFEHLGEYNGALLIDDFAHHPAEITASIAGARQRYPEKNLIVVFHPHTYSRTKALLDDFAASLTANEVIVMDIFGSARETEQSVSAQDLVAKIPAQFHAKVLSTVEDVVAYLRPKLSANDVVLLLGAGEQWKVAQELLHTNT